MIEMQAGGLALVFAQVTPRQTLRLAQARPALVLSMSPLALVRDEEQPATSSAVFAQLAAAGETLSQTRDIPMTPLMILRAEDDAILIGGEPQGRASFVAVVGGDVARTESGIHVGSTRNELVGALGLPVDDPERASDPRVVP